MQGDLEPNGKSTTQALHCPQKSLVQRLHGSTNTMQRQIATSHNKLSRITRHRYILPRRGLIDASCKAHDRTPAVYNCSITHANIETFELPISWSKPAPSSRRFLAFASFRTLKFERSTLFTPHTGRQIKRRCRTASQECATFCSFLHLPLCINQRQESQQQERRMANLAKSSRRRRVCSTHDDFEKLLLVLTWQLH